MIGDYGHLAGGPGLTFRKPEQIFVPLGWLAAGILNPAAYFAYRLWGMPDFNYEAWAWHAAAPLELGVLFALMFLREGGFGLGAIAVFTVLSILAACAITGPAYAFTTWIFQQNGVSLGILGWAPISNFDMAIAVSGSYIRASLLFAGVAALPAAALLRLVCFRRAPPKPRASPSAPPPTRAA
jgi:hypothetical protein